MTSHITRTVSACFTVVCELQSIRRSIPRSVFHSLVTSIVLMRLNHGNATFTGILLYLMKWLQSGMNSAAWLVLSSSGNDHISPLLDQLHWLKP